MKPEICSKPQVFAPECDEGCVVDCASFNEYKEQQTERDLAQDEAINQRATIEQLNEKVSTDVFNEYKQEQRIALEELASLFTKENILTVLGYDETEFSMSNACGNTRTWKVLAQEELPISLRGSYVSFNSENANYITKAKVHIANDDGVYGASYYDSSTVDYTEDRTPYLFRKSFAGGKAVDTLIGGSVAWNQLVVSPKFTNPTYYSANGATVTAADGVATVTANGDRTVYASFSIKTITANHVYLLGCTSKLSTNNQSSAPLSYTIFNWGAGGAKAFASPTKGVWTTWAFILKPSTGDSYFMHYYPFGTTDNTPAGDVVELKNPQVYDLTQMFGTAVADQLYQMEQANAGSGVALFRSWFPKDYYAYNTGEIMSVKTSAHEMVGKNQFNDNFADYEMPSDYRICPLNLVMGEQYVVSAVSDTSVTDMTLGIVKSGRRYADFDGFAIIVNNQGQVPSYSNPYIFTATEEWKDANLVIYARTEADFNKAFKAFKPQLEIGGTRTEYEPYQKRTYALDDIELRGVPKLDANGDIYWDGDRYGADGKVQKRFGIVTLDGTEQWLKSTSYTGNYYVAMSNIVTAQAYAKNVTLNIITTNGLKPVDGTQGLASNDLCILIDGGNTPNINIKNTSKETLDSFKSWLASNPITVIYELATPTVQTRDYRSYNNPQDVFEGGTEQYECNTTPAVPVGHETKYFDGDVEYRYKGFQGSRVQEGTFDFVSGSLVITKENDEETHIESNIGGEELYAIDGTNYIWSDEGEIEIEAVRQPCTPKSMSQGGLEWVTITPEFDDAEIADVLPLYWIDKDEEYLIGGGRGSTANTYTVTATPTDNWYAVIATQNGGLVFGEKGQPLTATLTVSPGEQFIVGAVESVDERESKYVMVTFLYESIQ